MLVVKRQRNYKQKIEEGDLMLYFHGVMSTNLLFLWVLASQCQIFCDVHNSRMERMVCLEKCCEPWHVVFMLTVLRVTPWRRGDFIPASLESIEGLVVSYNRLDLGDRSLALSPIVSQACSRLLRPVF